MCGLSVGWWITQKLVALYRECVAPLILMATLASLLSLSLEAREDFLTLRLKPLAEEDRSLRRSSRLPCSVRMPLKTRSSDWWPVSQHCKRTAIQIPSLLWRSLIRQKTCSISSSRHSWSMARTTLLTGLSIGKELKRRVTRFRFTMIPDADHLINLEKSTACEDAIRSRQTPAPAY